MTELKCTSWLGLTTYHEALLVQEESYQDIVRHHKKLGVHILGLENLKTITLGRRIHEKELNHNICELNGFDDFEIVKTDRGGEATLHSPGQLIIYPIIDLKYYKISIREWVCLLLKVTQTTLGHYGINSSSDKGSGLWTEKGKIAFLGLRVRNGISTHGLAINIKNDLMLFKKIVSCGVKNETFDSIGKYNPLVSTEDVYSLWIQEFFKLDFLKNSKIKNLCPHPSADSTDCVTGFE